MKELFDIIAVSGKHTEGFTRSERYTYGLIIPTIIVVFIILAGVIE